MTALFLGAGFSKWAFDLPLANQLFDFDVNTTSENEQKKLMLLEKDWNNWIGRNGKASPEEFIHWCINKSSHRKSRVIWYVSRRLTEPFMTRIQGSYTSVMFDERIVRENERVKKINAFLLGMKSKGLTGILTCNYDTLVECALGTSEFNYGKIKEQIKGRGSNPQFPWQNAHVYLMGDIPLAKLHGSLSWDNDKKYTSGKPGRAGKALIIPPAPEKTPPPELAEVWMLGREILQASKSLILFGFAFNPYDKALLEFLKKNGETLERILLIDPYPNLETAKALWPNAIIQTVNPLEKFDLENLFRFVL